MKTAGESCSVERAKHMRIVSICIAALLISGCATVSMTTGETVVKTQISENQSALREASTEYCETAEQRGWVAKATSIFGFANKLINGETQTADAELERDYAALIGAESEAPTKVFQRIAADAAAARAGLNEVTGTATGVLNGNDEAAGRGDVMSYERALINAQKSHRAFSKATDLAALRAGEVPEETEAALASLAKEIDAARQTADTLADRYAAIMTAASS